MKKMIVFIGVNDVEIYVLCRTFYPRTYFCIWFSCFYPWLLIFFLLNFHLNRLVFPRQCNATITLFCDIFDQLSLEIPI